MALKGAVNMEKVVEIIEVIESLEETEGGLDALSSVQAGETWS
ncbi:hypothetical protein ACFVX9_32540 [Kitasatospora sp. NPDC058243]